MAKSKDPNEGKPVQEPREQYTPPDQDYPTADPDADATVKPGAAAQGGKSEGGGKS